MHYADWSPPHNLVMRNITKWASLSEAAAFINVSVDTISRRTVLWTDVPQPGKVRYKLLKLGVGTRKERRYHVPDLETWLVED